MERPNAELARDMDRRGPLEPWRDTERLAARDSDCAISLPDGVL